MARLSMSPPVTRRVQRMCAVFEERSRRTLPRPQCVPHTRGMPLPRYVLPSPAIYHVTTRGVDRMPIAHDDADYTYVHRGIVAACFLFGWTYYAHCVMPNHYHLVLETELRRLSAGMQWLNFRIARRFNEKYDRVGHFVERRFTARVIDRDDYFENACLYVWNNAVRAGIVSDADDWPWCGCVYTTTPLRACDDRAPVRVRQRRRPRAERGDIAATPVQLPVPERVLGLHHLVDLGCALVDDRCARVSEVPLDPILGAVAVRAEHLDREV